MMLEMVQGSVEAVLRTIRAHVVGTKNSSLLPSCSYTNLGMWCTHRVEAQTLLWVDRSTTRGHEGLDNSNVELQVHVHT